MTIHGIVILNLIAFALLLWVGNLVRRGTLYAGYGAIFIIITVSVMFILSIPELLGLLVRLVGAVFPASALTLLALCFIVFMLIYILTQVTLLSNRLAVLVQALSIQQAREEAEGRMSERKRPASEDNLG